MILPTLWITCQAVGGNDLYGQPLMKKGRRVCVAPVKLQFGSAHTTVRTDSSGSHGHAQEYVATVVLLSKPDCGIATGDILTILSNNRVVVVEIRERFTPAGKLDHREIHCDAWKKP